MAYDKKIEVTDNDLTLIQEGLYRLWRLEKDRQVRTLLNRIHTAASNTPNEPQRENDDWNGWSWVAI